LGPGRFSLQRHQDKSLKIKLKLSFFFGAASFDQLAFLPKDNNFLMPKLARGWKLAELGEGATTFDQLN
jgi:hypothetical protein